MTKKHWILLNAPPLSGKDTLVLLIESSLKNHMHLKLSAPLKAGLKAFFSLSDSEYAFFENPTNKGVKHDRLGGLSWRQAQIDLAEVLVKPTWGRDTFSKILIEQAKPEIFDTGFGYFPIGVIIVSDLGFQFEADYFFEHKPYKSCTIINIARDGCTFDGDSREWVKFSKEQLNNDPNCANLEIHNNGTMENMRQVFVTVLGRERPDLFKAPV